MTATIDRPPAPSPGGVLDAAYGAQALAKLPLVQLVEKPGADANAAHALFVPAPGAPTRRRRGCAYGYVVDPEEHISVPPTIRPDVDETSGEAAVRVPDEDRATTRLVRRLKRRRWLGDRVVTTPLGLIVVFT